MLDRQYSDGLEAGVDEAGRGCLAGPVTAAAVILPENINLHQLNDSKKLTHKQREQLRPQIEAQAIAFAVAHVFPDEIDQINILNAAIKAMHLALNQLTQIPSFIAVDGNKFHPYSGISHQCIVKGDGKYMNIAAASVLAKTYRDDYMAVLDQEYPHYDWKQNKGYPTRKHREALQKFGTTSHHRKSFQLLPKQLVLKL
ncbi:MAG: ribonuclease HII [Bacteroidetes bacterium]|nr:ribonuclease HII [Bacteroidota bacterium]MDA0938635.1 ribonuclease HII [Bacteroidota bacterium]MDA1345568.1 ribonuclease HII [Bacteroidota bacterium]